MPPMPVAKITPARSETTSGVPASAQASEPAAIAYCEKRSVRRASFVSRKSVATKSGTSPATVTGRSEVSNCVIVRTPLRPDVMPVQKSSTPVPTGVTGPMPVTTTRGRSPIGVS